MLPVCEHLRANPQRRGRNRLAPAKVGDEPVVKGFHAAMVNQLLTTRQQSVDGWRSNISRMGNVFKKETFASRLTKLRDQDRSQPTYEDIASFAAGKVVTPVSKQAVQKWFNGKSVPDPEALKNLAGHYGVTKEWLYFGDSPKNPISMDVARGVDLLPEDERREVAKDIFRRLDGVKDIKLGGEHDIFMGSLKTVADTLKQHVKPRN